ncbi:hypothetical protein SV7mr_32950 [Stieleria bergensis]|uniref:Uncharacterized protein n=1 Tax=Stieleria bergensis TaxID=2528025 RepID=A0A517SXA5_9BACT|nr:hypothetical protein SV7mr_32950 [Planctomycetes bacterium SV_7m_r]
MHAQNPHHTQHNGQNKYNMGKSTKRLTSNTAAPASGSGRVLLMKKRRVPCLHAPKKTGNANRNRTLVCYILVVFRWTLQMQLL